MSNLLPPSHKVMCSAMECHLANDRIAVLEAENKALHERRLPYREAEIAQKRYEDAEAALEALDVCGPHCPACVEFTTVFTMPKVEYLGCLRKQSESTKLLNQTAAPIGQPCPYTRAEPDCDNCPQPHDEYNEPDCDACDAAWANEGGAK